MMRSLFKLATLASLAVLVIPTSAFAGRGGGMSRGGGGYGGAARGGGGYGGAGRDGGTARGGGMERGGGGYGGAQSTHSPSFSQPRSETGGSGYGRRNTSGNLNEGNRNVGAAAAGADYADRNNSDRVSNAGAAAAGAGYANRKQYDQYHPGWAGGYWNGNYGLGNAAGYGAMLAPSAAYGYGSSPYMNPYAGVGQAGAQPQPVAQPAAATTPDYSQPLDASAAPTQPPPTDPAASRVAQARQAFQTGDYANAQQLTQQELGQSPNDVSLHEFLALTLFAQGSDEQAAAPLYSVLSAGPGWNWTTLISNYTDASLYTEQFRGLQAFAKANPKSANTQFVLAYHLLSQGHTDAAIKPLKNVVALEPADSLSARLLAILQPAPATPADPTATPATAIDPTKLVGKWVAQSPGDTTITLTLSDAGSFSWEVAAKGQPPLTISGPSSTSGNILTLNGKDTPGGPLAGQVTLTDDTHMNFKAVGGPASDPGLQFAR